MRDKAIARPVMAAVSSPLKKTANKVNITKAMISNNLVCRSRSKAGMLVTPAQ